MKIHPESAKMFVVDEDVEKTKAAALRLLSRRAYTRKEINDKLTKREFKLAAIDTTLADLERLELIDDRVFAKRFVDERLRLKPCGRILLARDLKRRGVPVVVIDEIIEEAFDVVDTMAMAYEVLSARARRYERLEKSKAINRMFGFLARRGFDGGTARDVAKRVWQEIEDP
ncbi:MAG: regulatory protein RecX [Candidatus Latescibacteria bacterium]|nr:regulatory protein RecX [Candidatus Latescibacterota bacterium]MBT5832849.1 regulatory protein RecX [Candidatus Latescibacterota bacterium]